ncbi:MAG: nuclear transport factor 2 family protein [Gammaproteobacteria bacterium]|nr:MAG: nuclear transport factor 2 family protein [Gammaproteobacteria bacterium]
MPAFEDPVKNEIWATVRAMNDAWTKGNPDDLSRFFHKDMVAITATDRNRLDGGAACIAGWKGFCAAARIHKWEEKDPVIHVYGNAAVVAYFYEMSFDMGGKTIVTGGRDMFFFVKEGEKWWAVADQFSPYPV